MARDKKNISFYLNGEEVSVSVNPLKRLLDVLREDFGLTGVKEGCGEGECGACSVLLDGRIVNSCIVPVGYIDGKEIITIEGYSSTKRYRAIEEAFASTGAVQCGFCTPGFVMATESLLRKNPHPSMENIREGISGNLCRCTGYVSIVDGIRVVSEKFSHLWIDGEDDIVVTGGSRNPLDGEGLNNISSDNDSDGNECFFPKTLSEALEIKARLKAVPIAGGTDLMVKYKSHAGLIPRVDKPVIFLDGVEELRSIKVIDEFIEIGATTTLSDILESELLPQFLKEIVGKIAAPGVRNTATMGGNICNASPAGDTLPPLYLLNAEVILESITGRRILPIESFIVGPGKTVIADNELLIGIRFKNTKFDRYMYRKIGTRKANALSKVSFLGLVRFDSDASGTIEDIRIAFGAVGPVVVRSRELEKRLVGLKDVSQIGHIIADYERLVTPIDDQRSTAIYRKRVAINLLKKFLGEMYY